MTLLIIAGAVLFLMFVILLFSNKQTAGLRSQGHYPEKGKASNEDVLRLLRSGEKIHAIKCYREIHGVGLKEAKEAVEKIQASDASNQK